MTAALLLLLGVLGCLSIALSPLPSSEIVNPESSRAQAMKRAEARLGVTIGVMASLSFATLFTWSLGSTWPVWPMMGLAALITLAIHPWIFVKRLCIPLGLPRLAWALSRLGGHPWTRDPQGGAVLAGALAALRARVREPGEDLWLRTKLDASIRLRGAGLVAAGLLAANAGNRVRARRLLLSLDQLDPDLCPPVALQIAADWLVADAAVRGAWTEVAQHVETLAVPSRSAHFIALAARRLTGESIGNRRLLGTWLKTPRRLQTLGLLRLAMAGSTQAPNAAVQPEALGDLLDEVDVGDLAANDGGDPARTALSLHLETATSTAEPTRQINRLGEVWEQTLGGFPFRGKVRRRTLEIGCGISPELVLAEFRRDVADDLADIMLEAGISTDGLPTHERRVVGRAVLTVRARLLHRVQHAIGETRQLRISANSTTAIDMWWAWLEVGRRYADAIEVGGLPLRIVAYRQLEPEMRGVAAWLWNNLSERGLANAVSSWLMLEAERVDDQASAAYHRHNVALVI
ncbi:MAG: hypothetical protein JKY37_24990 [Nannocystaceae bacterium]|nr:hypothetical protein [Nannocystaceae bacterium]